MNTLIHRGALLAASAAIVFLAGCASKGAKTPSAALLGDVGSQTAELVTDIQFDLMVADSVEINQYIGEDTPASNAYLAAWEDMNLTLDILVDYSINLIDLAEVRQPSNEIAIEKLITLLADFEKNLNGIPSVAAHMPASGVNTVAAQMREQKTMVKAFGVAAPVLDSYAEAIQLMTLNVEETFELAVIELFDKIHDRHGPMLAFRENLIQRQNRALGGLKLVDDTIGGDKAAWGELLATNWNVSSAIGKTASASPGNIRKADQILASQLSEVATLREHLLLPYAAYSAQLTELYQIERQSRSVHKFAYLVALEWGASQARLAQGDPGLFKTVTSTMWRVAQKRLTG